MDFAEGRVQLVAVKAYHDVYDMRVGDSDGYGLLMEQVLTRRVRRLAEAYGSIEATDRQPATESSMPYSWIWSVVRVWAPARQTSSGREDQVHIHEVFKSAQVTNHRPFIALAPCRSVGGSDLIQSHPVGPTCGSRWGAS